MPKDLPFYVGIIKVTNGVPEITRKAHSLKHYINHYLFWKTLLKGLARHSGIKIKDHDKINKSFDLIENIKRKLAWNQYVVGFHQTWSKDYIPLTDKEKELIKAMTNLNYK